MFLFFRTDLTAAHPVYLDLRARKKSTPNWIKTIQTFHIIRTYVRTCSFVHILPPSDTPPHLCARKKNTLAWIETIRTHRIICTYVCTCFVVQILQPPAPSSHLSTRETPPRRESKQSEPIVAYTHVYTYIITLKMLFRYGSLSKMGIVILTLHVKS